MKGYSDNNTFFLGTAEATPLNLTDDIAVRGISYLVFSNSSPMVVQLLISDAVIFFPYSDANKAIVESNAKESHPSKDLKSIDESKVTSSNASMFVLRFSINFSMKNHVLILHAKCQDFTHNC